MSSIFLSRSYKPLLEDRTYSSGFSSFRLKPNSGTRLLMRFPLYCFTLNCLCLQIAFACSLIISCSQNMDALMPQSPTLSNKD